MNKRHRLGWGLGMGLLGTLLSLPLSFPARADPTTTSIGTLLAPYEATYRLQQGPLTLARATFTLRRKPDKDEWTLTSRTEAKGWLATLRDDRIEETSRFRLDGDRLLPLHYQMKHQTPGETKTETADFNWVTNRVTGAVDEAAFSLPLEPHTYDRLSLQILVRAAAFKQVNPIRIRMLEKNKIKALRLEVASEPETIRSPAGSFETLRITQVDSKKPLTFWLAPAASYLPIRVEQHRGSLHLKLELESLRSGDEFSAALTRAAK
jgi:hypothetical protein